MIDSMQGVLRALRELTWLRIVIAPLLGAVIGYITNDLALKMLFRPYEEKRIGRFRVPFTPGLIPSQKARIAKSLGGVIAGKLLNADTLRREALSDQTLEKLRGAIAGWLERQSADEQPLRERMEAHVAPERVTEWEEKLADRGADILMDKLRAAGLGDIVAEQVLASVRGKLSYLHMGFLMDGALESLRGSIARSVEHRLEESDPALIRQKIYDEEDALLGKSVSEFAAGHRERIPELTEALLGLYSNLFDAHIDAMLGAVHLDEIIERRIESFSARELEKVIFGVARRELRAIVYLGALLGCLMGFINLLF